MYCWHCGHKNAEGNKFCGECGKKQLRPADLPEETAETSGLISNQTQSNDARVPASPAGANHKILLTDPLVDNAPPKRTERTFARRANDRQPSLSPTRSIPEPIPSDFGVHPSQADQPAAVSLPKASEPTQVISNPLVNEPGAVRESVTAKNLPPPPAAITPPPPAPITPAPIKRPANRISGPSFLGLSNEPSSDSSYLLDDEDMTPASSSSWPGVLALTLLIVFGVLLVKQWSAIHDFANTYAQKAGLTREDKTSAKSNDAIHHPPAAVSASGSEIAESANSSDNGQKKPADSKTQLAGNKTDKSSDPSRSEDLQKPENDNDGNPKSSRSAKEPVNKPSDAADVNTNTPKPSAEHEDSSDSKKSYDNSPIQLAEKYIYGRGVPQDCGRAMSLLQSSAGQHNPNAEIKLGALYATGQCVAQDRAQAYVWYSKAKRLEPGNTWLDYSLNSLWASMSDEERKRAQSL